MAHPSAAPGSRLFSWRRLAIAVACLIVAGALLASYQINAVLSLKPGPNEYNISAWTARNFPNKWLFLAGQLLRGSISQERQDEKLRSFFTLTREINILESRLSDTAQRGSAIDEALVVELEEKRRQRESIERQVHATLESRISAALREEGLTRSFLVELVWPPVNFEFTETPRVLATSPRDEIRLASTTLLREDLTLSQVEAIEARVEDRDDVSALAFPTGGIGAYPAIITYRDDYFRAVEVIAHEWAHNYLFFYPLGFNYYKNNDLRTMNETVADIIGLEIARLVVARWPLYPDEAPAPPAVNPPPDRPRIDLGVELRSLRGQVDKLLAQGEIEEAEALMEQRRQELADHGYNIRKLNQAYFAYLNLYAGEAGSPAAVNPIGPMLDDLRRASASLKEFIDTVSGFTNVRHLEEALARLEQ